MRMCNKKPRERIQVEILKMMKKAYLVGVRHGFVANTKDQRDELIHDAQREAETIMNNS